MLEHIWAALWLRPACPAGILEQSAVWVDEVNYDMRTNRNKGISPFSLRPSNPLGIEMDKYGSKTYKDTHIQFPPP